MDWVQDREEIVTFNRFTYVLNISGLHTEVIKTNHDLPWAGLMEYGGLSTSSGNAPRRYPVCQGLHDVHPDKANLA
jgi:hypothetical protein